MNLRDEVQRIGQENPRRRQRACDLITAYDSAKRLINAKDQSIKKDAECELCLTERAMEIFTGCSSLDRKTK